MTFNPYTTVFRSLARILSSILITVLIGTYSLSLQATLKPLNKVVALVNNNVITQSELDKRLDMAHKHNAPLSPQKALEELIIEQLQIQRAAQMGASINDIAIDKVLELVAEQNHITVSQLLNAVEQEGMTVEEYKNELKKQHLISFVIQKEVVQSIQVTEQEIQQFLNTAKDALHQQNSQTAQYRLGHFLISLPANPSPTQLKKANEEAQQILEKLRLQQSVPLTDLGWRKITEVPTLFVSVVTNMKKSEASGPIQSESGLHIIQLLDKNESSKALSGDLATQKEQAQRAIKNRKAHQKLNIFLEKLRNDAYIQIYLPDEAEESHARAS